MIELLTLIVDCTVMALLTLTIVFCWRLNNKIMELKAGRRDLLELIKTLDSAIIKTNANIGELKVMTQNSALELNSLVNQAQELISDLSFMNDTAHRLADRLDNSISESRYISEKLRGDVLGGAMTNDNETSAEYTKDADSGMRYSKAREELMTALKSMK